MELDETKIRNYLLRKIADSNKKINGIMYEYSKSCREGYNGGFKDIVTVFAGGDRSMTLKKIITEIERNPKKRYSVYHYFDVDTLISYDAYLNNIINTVNNEAFFNGHRKPTISDFKEGFAQAKQTFRENEKTSKSGYYDKTYPISLSYINKNGRLSLNPVKPLGKEEFNKQYDIEDCRKELEKYITAKHGSISSEKAEEMTEPMEYMDYKFRGFVYRLYIQKKEYFTNEQGGSIVSIKATGNVGTLYGVYNNDGSIYRGNIYNLEGDLVETNGGGETFYTTINFDEKPKDKYNAYDDQPSVIER